MNANWITLDTIGGTTYINTDHIAHMVWQKDSEDQWELVLYGPGSDEPVGLLTGATGRDLIDKMQINPGDYPDFEALPESDEDPADDE
ncbi:MAG: hypothetical protein J0M33_23890 [Anaerolineae bacterium]|nr:hypothetical protein [Anaerolineae bacterium]